MATKKTTSGAKRTVKKEVSNEDINKRAQEIYEERVKTNKPGDELSDWLQAEKDLGK